MDPTVPSSVVWRAFAYNQKEPKAEIKEVLAQAISNKSTRIDYREMAEKVNKCLEKLKTFIEFREKMGEVVEHKNAVSASEVALKALHADHLIVAMGNGLFKWTLLGQLGDCAGALTIRGLLMLRVGMNKDETFELIKYAAKVEPAMRTKLQNGYRALRATGLTATEAHIRALHNLADDEAGQGYRAKWAAVKLSDEGKELAGGVRIAGTLAVIELLSFGCGLAKADKTGEDYAMLVAGGFSSMSACLQASTKLMTSLEKEAIKTLANLKAISGYSGGASAMIGAVVDFGKGLDEKKNNKLVGNLYFVKSALGFAATASNVLTALTSSAPLVARVTGGRSVVFLGKLSAGMAGANASTSTLAGIARGTTAEATAARTAAADGAARVAMTTAAEEATVVVTERVALLTLGRAVLFLAGWEVAVVVTLVQVLIWYFSDDDLQVWFRNCAFGNEQPHPAWDGPKQHEEYEKALKALGFPSSEGAE
jgi:hypothetical protein